MKLRESIPNEEIIEKESNKDLDMEYGDLSSEEKEKMEIVTEQFNNPQFVEIPMPGNEEEKMKIEYVILDARGDQELKEALASNDRTVVYVPGFNASYRNPQSFTKLMAVRENKRVIIISMPSTGQSDPPPIDWRKWKRSDRSFEPFVDVLNNSLDSIRESEISEQKKTTDEISLVSASMGSMIATEMAAKYPDKVKDLVLMHPAGVNEEKVLQLAKRFYPEILGGKKVLMQNPEIDLEYKKELEDAYQKTFGKSLQEAYEEAGGEGKFDLQDADTQAHDFSKQVSKNIQIDGTPNTIKNPLWRVWEALSVAKGGILKMLPKVKANIYVIYGASDNLFPSSQVEKMRDKLENSPNTKIDIFPSMIHDSIYQDARKYTSSVGAFLNEMRKKES
jgi:pimeloyl-ACP methyl ester carboxylesterase